MTTDERQLPEAVRLTFEYIRTDIREAVGNVGGQRDRLLNLVEQLRAQVIALPQAPADGWQDISTIPSSDDLIWLANTASRSIEGPRRPSVWDADQFDLWCPCEPPSIPSLIAEHRQPKPGE